MRIGFINYLFFKIEYTKTAKKKGINKNIEFIDLSDVIMQHFLTIYYYKAFFIKINTSSGK